ncbi:unnamed protein product, partial [Ixodes pacificus]
AVSDPLRFVKIGQAALGTQAREQVHGSVQRKKCHAAEDEQEEQWQTNLDEWKSRRRKASQRAFQRVQDAKQLFPDSSQARKTLPQAPPCLTTGTELLSEYSSKASPPLASRSPRGRDQQRKAAPASNCTPASNSTSAASREKACTKIQPPEPAAGKPEAPTEGTLSVSGRRLCSHCSQPLGHGAAMVIESLQLLYHLACFRCCVCQAPLGNGLCGTDVRVRNTKLHCTDCYSNDEGKCIRPL